MNDSAPTRDALFVSAGDHHLLHPSLSGSRDFDVLIAWYGSDEAVEQSLRSTADLFLNATGGKFQNLWTLWQRGELTLDGYDSVFVADDDVSLTSRQIAALFRRRRELDATILSPAHSTRGVVSHRCMFYRPDCDHHFTNFVENGTPVFRTDALIRFLNDFDGSLVGWGIDYWYTNLFDEDPGRRYVVDNSVIFVNPWKRTGSSSREIERLGNEDHLKAQWHRVREERELHDIEPVVLKAVPARLPLAIWRTVIYTGIPQGDPAIIYVGVPERHAVIHPKTMMTQLRRLAGLLRRRLRPLS